MLTSYYSSVLLLSVWLIAYFVNRRRLYSSKIYFIILFLMALAGIVLDLDTKFNYYTNTYSVFTMLLFSGLMLLVVIPWKVYDDWMCNVIIEVNTQYIRLIKNLLIILIVSSALSILYCFPYAMKAMAIGGYDVRVEMQGGFLPANLFTTFVSACAGLSPIGLLFFFISVLDEELRKFSILILLVPLAGIVHSMACAARELYIYLPITFIILYHMFYYSLSEDNVRKINRIGVVMFCFLIVFFLSISISRFGEIGSNSFISGTWGYIYQQPYVFDQNLRFFDNFYGFDRRLTFLGSFLGIGDGQFELHDSIEWSFGTMYSEFYQISGYDSLLVGSIIYFLFFYGMCIKAISTNSGFATVVNFTIFVWFTISGLFYFRYGVTSYFLLYLLIIIFSFYCPDFLIVVKKNERDGTYE